MSKSVEIFCDRVLRYLRQPACSLSVVFVSAGTMRSLNGKFRGKAYATDVLSFRYEKEFLEGLPFLGELVISPQVAYKQARGLSIPPEREIRVLLTHGMLHLLGYDHERDEGEMEQLQNRIMRSRLFRKSLPVAEMEIRK